MLPVIGLLHAVKNTFSPWLISGVVMSTQFHALRLPEKVTQHVVNLSSRNYVDLNTVFQFGSMFIIGEIRCGKLIHVQHVLSAFGHPEHYTISVCDMVNDQFTNRIRVTV